MKKRAGAPVDAVQSNLKTITPSGKGVLHAPKAWPSTPPVAICSRFVPMIVVVCGAWNAPCQARKLLEQVDVTALPGQAALIKGYYHASQGRCDEAEKHFNRASALGETCIPERYRSGCSPNWPRFFEADRCLSADTRKGRCPMPNRFKFDDQHRF